ncbi:MAG: 30S ribosomal protein S20 [Candidatus Shapirobacteria bacterium]
MPITESAKKFLRQSKKKAKINKLRREKVKKAIKELEKKPIPANLKKAFSEIDKAVKKKIVHQNKASRWKSRLSKLVKEKTPRAKMEKKKSKK